jgi:hypothetical protein
VAFSVSDGTDGSGSGVDVSTRSVTRETGDLVAGACSNFSADAGSFSSPDIAVSTGHCYRYTFTIADRVGNVSTSVTATAKVDTDAPIVAATAPTELTGAGNQYYDAGSQTQFFRPAGSGSFTLHATASDGHPSRRSPSPTSSLRQRLGFRSAALNTNPCSSQRLQLEHGRDRGARSITATNAAGIDGNATITSRRAHRPTARPSLHPRGANAPYCNAASVTFLTRRPQERPPGFRPRHFQPTVFARMAIWSRAVVFPFSARRAGSCQSGQLGLDRSLHRYGFTSATTSAQHPGPASLPRKICP